MGLSLRDTIENLLREICGRISAGDLPPIIIEKPRIAGHGDLATNIALLMANGAGRNPLELAEEMVDILKKRPDLFPSVATRIEVAGPGFINFFLSPSTLQGQLRSILENRDNYGSSNAGRGEKVQIEFVSANPTGPLTVAHGRQAAVGDSLARIMEEAGYRVEREYYLNDRGRQIRLLGLSAYLRYRELSGEGVELPPDGYRGEYVKEIALQVKEEDGDMWLGKEEDEAIDFFAALAIRRIKEKIIRDLEEFNVAFDNWTSEDEFAKSGRIEQCLDHLRGKGLIYDKDGAVWFRSSQFGDDKDRVLIKSGGEMTYLAPDIAYHQDKFERGFRKVIDLWGPDHHGYINRMKAAVQALEHDSSSFRPMIVQLTTLYRGDERLSMSTRAGEFVTLREVMDEVGVDASRYFFVRMKIGSHLNFDLDLAKRRSNDNPVYYVQYVHARVSSIFKKLKIRKPGFRLPPLEEIATDLLTSEEELKLLKLLADFPFVVENSALSLEPNRICNYLEETAAAFHQCYTRHRVISEDDRLTSARLALAEGVRIVVRNGLNLLGVTAPDKM